MKKRRIVTILLTGALIGGLLTAPLIVVLHLGWKLAGLPFAPYEIFDWMVRALPGAVVTFGIDSMVSVIHGMNLGGTADVAKTAEQIMAVVMFFVGGAVAGAVLFTVLRRFKTRAIIGGLTFGAIFGGLVLLVSHSLERTIPVNPWIDGFWTFAVFLIWGVAFGWITHRLRGRGEAAAELSETENTSVERLDRRRFLIRLGGATTTVTVVGAVVDLLFVGGRSSNVPEGELWSAHNVLPKADASVQPVPGTRPEFTPLKEHYRIDINLMPPIIEEDDWRLTIGGLVEQPLEMTLGDIRGYEPMHQFITLSCISNPVGGDLISTTRWTGVSLGRLLSDWKLKPSATHLKISSADGFYEVVALETIHNDERVMLTYAWDGVPLLTKHGFPLRIYVPDIYGMKQPKWIESIEATDHWEPGYWVVRGWSRKAQIRTTSVIDTIAADAIITKENGQKLVPVGGIAHAGARGISKVEVRVDDGPWREARLRKPLSGVTWVIWRYEMPFQDGPHVLTVRCYEGDGTLQIVRPSPPHPDGATGLHNKSMTL